MLAALVDNTLPQPDDGIALARSVLVENESGGGGAALALGDAQAALGNLVVARNGSGAALTGTRLRLVNSVVADNAAVGIDVPAGGTVSIGNSVIFRNAVNCALAAPPTILGPNLQDPGTDCGNQIATADPGLDGSYAPDVLSAARNAGDYGLCISEPTVAGIDIHGTSRTGPDQKCAIGAVERDLFETIAAGLSFDTAKGMGQCLMWILFFLLLLVFLIAFLLRRIKKTTP